MNARLAFPIAFAAAMMCGAGAAPGGTARLMHLHPDAEMAVIVVDDGAGRWFPGAQGISEYPLDMPKRPGTAPDARWMSLSISGDRSPWVAVPDIAPEGPEGEPLHAEIRASDGKPGILSVSGSHPYDKLWIAVDLDGLRALRWIELTPAESGGFPEDFEIETSADGGHTWHPVPSARFFHFPNPGESSVCIPLHGVVADAVRVVSFRRADASAPLTLGSLRVYGDLCLTFDSAGAEPAQIAAWNNLWVTFGTAENEIHERRDPTWPTGRPFSGGMLAILTAEWSFWNALKMSWRDAGTRDRFASALASFPVDEGGYVWLTPFHDKHLEHSRHYVATPVWLSAVAYHYLLTRDEAFLNQPDPRTGETMRSKFGRALAMLTDRLGGETGVITLDDPELQGTPDCKGNNYWDAWPFGHLDAYMNAHFYEALGWSADLYEALGDDPGAARLRALRPKVRERFNELFWDDEAGRYIGWIDQDGKRVDFGFVFLNLKAVAFGLADDERAVRVMEWIRGERAVAGDTTSGEDIYHFRIAPRSTTRAAESVDDEYFKLFWGGDNTVAREGSPAAWGLNAQNGGIILYVSYYDLHARKASLGAADAMGRMDVILDEAAQDGLRRMPKNPMIGIGTPVGILREFPESGIVPVYFVDGVMGIRPVPKGLEIAPALPDGWSTATVRDFHFAGRKWEVTADREVKVPQVEVHTGGEAVLVVPADGVTLLSPEGTPELVGRSQSTQETK